MKKRKREKGSTRRGDGIKIPPGSGVVPILQEVGHLQLKVVGTGFFLTRYGVFATARHVLDELADYQSNTMRTGFVLQNEPTGELYIRRIVGISVSNNADVGIGQAENGVGGMGALGPINLRGPISLTCPAKGELLMSYAYPENTLLDFNIENDIPTLHGDYVSGKFIEKINPGARPFIPYAHFETSLEIRSGASGCPIFNKSGRIVAISCRGWEFQGGEYEGDDLSSVIPVSHLLPMELGCIRVPPDCWEYSQIPIERRSGILTFLELIQYGHIDMA